MNKKQSKHGLARVWPALGAMAIVAAGLAGGAGIVIVRFIGTGL